MVRLKSFLGRSVVQKWGLAFILSVMFVVVGCGQESQGPKNRADVSGTVTFAGTPLKGGSISFHAAETHVATTTPINEGGTFSTDRAPLGTNYVTIETESLKFGNAAAYVKIPKRYNDPETSGLTAEIKEGENSNVDFALTSEE